MTVAGVAARRWAAHLWVPSGRRGSHLDDVVQVAELMGMTLDDWQCEAIDTLTAYGRGGVPLATERAVVVGRQSGKTKGVGRPILVTEAVLGAPGSLMFWTAHLLDTCLAEFKAVRAMVARKRDGSPEDAAAFVPALAEYVVDVVDENGSEAILWRNPSRPHDPVTEVAYRARSKGMGRGRSPRLLFGDEALFVTAAQAASFLPGIAAQGPHAGVLWLSSACLAESEYLRGIVRRGRAGGDDGLAYVEHSAPGSFEEPTCEAGVDCTHVFGVGGCALDDDDARRAGSPAIANARIAPAVLSTLRRTMTPTDFAREFLGWHDGGTDGQPGRLSPRLWAGRVDAASRVAQGRTPVFTLDVEPDSRCAAIGVGGYREDGARHVGLVAKRAGVAWALDELERLDGVHGPAAIVVDGTNPAVAGLLPDLEERGLRRRAASNPAGRVVVLTAGDVAQACVGALRSVRERELWHRGDDVVREALTAAKTVPAGDGGWRFARKSTTEEITALYALVLADHGARVFLDPDESSDPRDQFG